MYKKIQDSAIIFNNTQQCCNLQHSELWNTQKALEYPETLWFSALWAYKHPEMMHFIGIFQQLVPTKSHKCYNLQHSELWNTQKRSGFEHFGLTSNQKCCIS